ILHGLCTFGFAGRAVLQSMAKGDPDRVRSVSARFASPVLPGDVLHVDVWHTEGGGRFRVRKQDGTVVLSNGSAVLA
ncbi:MAG: 3-hydroxyacyl-thioester dehydratase, partial [Actinomycetota bacterium]|nr:3-hydroxyacyl-thioester dehydratase [Actinomycetota bacterium]